MNLEPRKFPRLVYAPPDEPLRILHHDEDLLVLSKPIGLLSVPGKLPGLQDSLQTRVLAEFPEALLVHRLDMDTSGLFIMARNKPAQSHLAKQFQYRKADKHYIAKIWGIPPQESGMVDLPLRCDWENRPLQMVCYEHGRPSQTHWEVLESMTLPSLRAQRSNPEAIQADTWIASSQAPRNDEQMISRVKLSPVTGRSHQLRVHMAELNKENGGHPILGDTFYAHEAARDAADRLLLHAQSLTINHPKNNERITFTDPAPF